MKRLILISVFSCLAFAAHAQETVYRYVPLDAPPHENPGLYVGSELQSLSPRDGVWLDPADTTRDAPPDLAAGEAAKMTVEGIWEITPDFRGAFLWDKRSGARLEIKTIGPLPEYATGLEPQPGQVWNNDRWETPAPVEPVKSELELKVDEILQRLEAVESK